MSSESRSTSDQSGFSSASCSSRNLEKAHDQFSSLTECLPDMDGDGDCEDIPEQKLRGDDNDNMSSTGNDLEDITPLSGVGNEISSKDMDIPEKVDKQVVYISDPDFSTLSLEEKAELKMQLRQRMEKLTGKGKFGEIYVRRFPSSQNPDGPFPSQLLMEWEDGSCRVVEFREEESLKQEEADNTKEKLPIKLPPRPIPTFLEIIQEVLSKDRVCGPLVRNGEISSGSSADAQDEPEPCSSKKCMEEACKTDQESVRSPFPTPASQSSTSSEDDDFVFTMTRKIPSFAEFQSIREKSPKLAEKVAKISALHIQAALEKVKGRMDAERRTKEEDRRREAAERREKRNEERAAQALKYDRHVRPSRLRSSSRLLDQRKVEMITALGLVHGKKSSQTG